MPTGGGRYPLKYPPLTAGFQRLLLGGIRGGTLKIQWFGRIYGRVTAKFQIARCAGDGMSKAKERGPVGPELLSF